MFLKYLSFIEIFLIQNLDHFSLFRRQKVKRRKNSKLQCLWKNFATDANIPRQIKSKIWCAEDASIRFTINASQTTKHYRMLTELLGTAQTVLNARIAKPANPISQFAKSAIKPCITSASKKIIKQKLKTSTCSSFRTIDAKAVFIVDLATQKAQVTM